MRGICLGSGPPTPWRPHLIPSSPHPLIPSSPYPLIPLSPHSHRPGQFRTWEICLQNRRDGVAAAGARGGAHLAEARTVAVAGAGEDECRAAARQLEAGALDGAVAKRAIQDRPELVAAHFAIVFARHEQARRAAACIAGHDADGVESAADGARSLGVEGGAQ